MEDYYYYYYYLSDYMQPLLDDYGGRAGRNPVALWSRLCSVHSKGVTVGMPSGEGSRL